MALAPILNKEKERKPGKLERAAQIFGMAQSVAGMAGSIGGMGKGAPEPMVSDHLNFQNLDDPTRKYSLFRRGQK